MEGEFRLGLLSPVNAVNKHITSNDMTPHIHCDRAGDAGVGIIAASALYYMPDVRVIKKMYNIYNK